MSTPSVASIPALLQIHAGGGIDGRNARYEVHLSRLYGVYSNTAAYAERAASVEGDPLVYEVESHSYDAGAGSLTIGTSTLLPGTIGDELALTRGHLHELADRAELYYCLSGRGLLLMDSADGHHEIIELSPGKAAHVPGRWIHRSVNVGPEPFVTLFAYNSDAGQDYEVIAEAGGMSHLVLTDGAGGWMSVANPRHAGYSRAVFG